MIKTILIAGATVVCVAIAPACGGGGSGGDRESEATQRDISNEELGRMLLALDQFGPEFAQFAAADDNGALDLEQAAQEEDDPNAERGDLQQFGYASGNKAFYSHPAFEGSGVYYLGGVIYMFRAEDGASGYFSDSLDEIRKLDPSDPDVSFDTVATYDLDVADQSAGARIEGSVKRSNGSQVPIWGAVAYIRHGRLDGALTMFGLNMSDADKQRLEGKVKTLAADLNDRITGALAGTAPPSP